MNGKCVIRCKSEALHVACSQASRSPRLVDLHMQVRFERLTQVLRMVARWQFCLLVVVVSFLNLSSLILCIERYERRDDLRHIAESLQCPSGPLTY